MDTDGLIVCRVLIRSAVVIDGRTRESNGSSKADPKKSPLGPSIGRGMYFYWF